MSFLDEVRTDREPLAHVLKKHRGIRKIVEDLYPDRAHFIYELLQNAEDTGATEASFFLTKDSVSFEHNGRPFSKQDVWGITDIGEGTKAGAEDKIGRFGVGFKAVFAYSETPHIWSPTFSFKISELVLPAPITPRSDIGQKTRFEFPFNNSKKSPENARAEIEAGLKELAETTLLFLSNLKVIRWKEGATSGEVLRIDHSDSHIEVFRQTDGKTVSASHFLRFTESVSGMDTQHVAVAYALDFLPNVTTFEPGKPFEKQLKIVAVTPGAVAVFFPAEKETSGLRFHLHAPFVPELSRASIKETPANEPLFTQLGELAAASLHKIREMRLLNSEFLGVLPNPQDTIPPRYQPILSAIIEEMNNEALTPTHSKSHAPAKHLFQAKTALKELLSGDDLAFLVDHDAVPPQWVASAPQKNSLADRFLSGLEIEEWEIEQFVEILEKKTATQWAWQQPDEDFLAWLGGKPVEWHQQLYSVLWSDLTASPTYLRKRAVDRLKSFNFVRLGNGKYSMGGECYFPTEAVTHDETLPRVSAAVYSSGRNKGQQEEARKFLEEIGVREVGEAEEIHAILKQRYTDVACRPELKDIKRFIALLEKDPSQAKLFGGYFIFERTDGKWGKPEQVFLDAPYLETGLRVFHEAIESGPAKAALAPSYKKSGIEVEKLRKFAETVGVQTKLTVMGQSTEPHPSKRELRSDYYKHNVKWTNTAIDEDWTIPDLGKALEAQSVDISRLIWRTMREAGVKALLARYRPNKQYETKQEPSSLVLILQQHAWIPQTSGDFVQPSKASRELLPDGFPFDAGDPFIRAINFGATEQKRSDERKLKESTAREFGFSDAETLERAKRFAALPQVEQERILAESQKTNDSDLPEHEPRNPERRAEHVGRQAAGAPERTTETRERSVSIGREDVKREAEQYLREQYTNSDGEVICQVCKAPLPFKLDDGTYYLEKVEFLEKLKRRHRQNYLALCPNHSAMFQHANGSRDSMKEAFTSMLGSQLEIVLAQSDTTIYFTKTHIADIRTLIEVDEKEKSETDEATIP